MRISLVSQICLGEEVEMGGLEDLLVCMHYLVGRRIAMIRAMVQRYLIFRMYSFGLEYPLITKAIFFYVLKFFFDLTI